MSKKRGCILFTAILVLAFWCGTPLYAQQHNCDFAAVIAARDHLIAEITDGFVHPHDPIVYDCPEDFFYDFIIDRSSSNPNGYGIVYSRDGETHILESQTAYTSTPYDDDPEPLNDMHDQIMDPANEAVMVMAHDRFGTGGAGNHPFTFEWEGTTYCFMHNGAIPDTLKHALWYELYYEWPGDPGSWFEEFPSNWVDPEDTWYFDNFIDSEIVFHWIMKHVIQADGSLLTGLYQALTAVVDNPIGHFDLYDLLMNQVWSYTLNFVLSDCRALYAFRNTPINGSSYNISYKAYTSGFTALKTQGTISGGTNVQPRMLVYLPRGGSPYPIANFLSQTLPSCFKSGDITSNTQWTGALCLSGDVRVLGGAVLDIGEDAAVEFGGAYDLTVEAGEAVLLHGSEMRLGNGSEIGVIGANSRFELTHGSSISAFRLADQVCASDGGLLFTDDVDTPERIRLYSRSGDSWGGVLIQYPRNYVQPDSTYFFRNCDLSECQLFSMEGNDSASGGGRLEFYESTFTHSDRMRVLDRHELVFDKSAYRGNVFPLTIDQKAKLNLYVSQVEKNGWGGLYIGYTKGPILIKGCSFYGNGQSGVESHGDIVVFIDNKVVSNCCSPMPVGTPAGLKLMDGARVTGLNGFANNVFIKNGRAEYEAGYFAFNWPNQNNSFYNHYGYVLICSDYDQQPHPEPRPVYGNTFDYVSQWQFLPRFEAFDFGTGTPGGTSAGP